MDNTVNSLLAKLISPKNKPTPNYQSIIEPAHLLSKAHRKADSEYKVINTQRIILRSNYITSVPKQLDVSSKEEKKAFTLITSPKGKETVKSILPFSKGEKVRLLSAGGDYRVPTHEIFSNIKSNAHIASPKSPDNRPLSLMKFGHSKKVSEMSSKGKFEKLHSDKKLNIIINGPSSVPNEPQTDRNSNQKVKARVVKIPISNQGNSTTTNSISVHSKSEMKEDKLYNISKIINNYKKQQEIRPASSAKLSDEELRIKPKEEANKYTNLLHIENKDSVLNSEFAKAIKKNLANTTELKSTNNIQGSSINCISSKMQEEINELSQHIRAYFTTHKEYSQFSTDLSFYRIGKLLGKGAFGRVNLGMHKLSGKYVAIKSLNKKYIADENSHKKVMREVSILKQLRHPNVMRNYETFESQNHILFVTELCTGGDLLNYVRKRRKLKECVAKVAMKQILDGLYHIHSKSILHRDIKLDNILLTSSGEIKICDFGVSKLMVKGKKIKEQCGTPAYIAPEILRDEGYEGFEVDIWSAGGNIIT
jgi:tRNA A-37 threonylcarbamoyl transferase component Bud32